jgi:hypothetical protein
MKVFVSYSHQDKPIARRIVRFLRSYGVDAWLDERELRLGSRLDDAISLAINESDALVVVATQSAAQSQWVEREVAFARESRRAISIVPVYVDAVKANPSFGPYLGVDASDRQQFAEVLVRLAEELVGSPLPQPDLRQLEEGLAELSRQSPGIALLVESCVRGEGLFYEHVRVVSESSFYELDEALDVISRLKGSSHSAAFATAALFSRVGAGSAALSRYVAEGHKVLPHALGETLDLGALASAIRLLSGADPRDDQALASFLWKNADSLTKKYRSEVIHLVTSPDRGPKEFGADAAAAALDLFPEDDDLVILWSRWIREGLFDGEDKPKADRPRSLAYWCARGLKAGSGGWSRIFSELVGHVRHLARTKSKQAVYTALEHMKQATDENNPRFRELVQECSAAPGTAEWDGWDDREEMSDYVWELTKEAFGERRWGSAGLRARESFKAMKALRAQIEQADSDDS